jgi:hypothetical protein
MASMTLEMGVINLKYEKMRLRDERREETLLSRIAQRGLEEPLEGIVVTAGNEAILLDGFKRYRCAKRLNLGMVPWSTIADSEGSGLTSMLMRSNAHTLHILEQARLVDELKREFRLTVGEIATRLSRSTGWVSVRLGLLSEMSPKMSELVFSGRFPVRTYLYTVRHFTRVKRIAPREVEEFMQACAGRKLSTRQLEVLARGYFEGRSRIRDEIRQGNFDWSLTELRGVMPHDDPRSEGLSEVERGLIRDLDMVTRALARISLKSRGAKISSAAFCAEAELFCGGLLGRFDLYRASIQEIYAQCRKKKHGIPAVEAGNAEKADCPSSGTGSENRPRLH